MVQYSTSNDDRSGDLSGDQASVKQSSSKSKKSAGAFRTISEVATLLDVQQHVLRFWETKFTHVKPLKRGGGRRYYRPEDIELLTAIHNLLYTQGYTIKGVQKLFKEQGKAALVASVQGHAPASSRPLTQASNQSAPTATATSSNIAPKQRALLESTLHDLKDMRRILKKQP